MSYRFMAGLFLAATLSGCGDNGLSNAGASGADTAAFSATATVTPIILQGVPANTATVGGNYVFQPIVSSDSGVDRFAIGEHPGGMSSHRSVVTFAIEALPAWASFDTSTGELSGTPRPGDVGLTGDITITATNGSNAGSVGPFTIRVNPVTPPSGDSPPSISGTPASTVMAGQSYTFQPMISDAAGNPLTVSISNCPTWATFNTASGRLSGTPSGAQVGTYSNIVMTVSDGTTSVALATFSIIVVPSGPDTPVIGGAPPSSVVAGQAYSFQPAATDPASKTLTFSITHAPSWATFSTSSGKLTGTPTVAQAAVYSNIVITVGNGALSASLPAFTITVTAPAARDAPLISGTPATSVVAGQAYSFQPDASDPAGKTLMFSIVNRPTWASFNTATGHLSGTPTAAQSGSYPSIGISVSNGTSSAALPEFSIVVTKATPAGAPTISGSPATSVIAGNAYSFTPSTTNPRGAKLTFSINNAPSWASFDNATGELSGTATAADVGTYSNITISVSDGTTGASLASFPIAVTDSASGSVTLDWSVPTANADGTPLTNLAGYWIYYGTSASAMTKTVKIANPGIVTYVLSNLSPGTWYFSLTTYTTANVQSDRSAVASGIIQ
jgi:putative Ig domain-containing protein